MTVRTRPDVYIEERVQLEGPITPAAVGFGCLFGTTEKGPAVDVTRTRNFTAWKKIYGDRQVGSDMAYEAKAFFDEGGVELITSRVVHLTDVDDKTSFTGAVASTTASTEGVAASAATKETAVPGPYNMVPGDAIDIDVDNVGVASATWDATNAIAAGAAATYAALTGLTLILEMNNDGNVQTITFTGAAVDAATTAAEINAQMTGGSAQVNAGEIDIHSDLFGTDSEVDITGGTALAAIGHSIGTNTGTGDVGNIDAVTAAEIKAIIEADTTALVTVNPDQTFIISSPTTGPTSELDFQASAGLAVLGLSVEVIVGTAAGATFPTLTLEAGFRGDLSPGVRGNDLQRQITKNPKHPSAGAGSDLAADATALDTELQLVTLSGLGPKSLIKLDDGTNVEYHEILEVRSVVVAGVVTFFVDLVGALVNSFTAALTTIESREFDVQIYEDNTLVETWEQMSMLDTADNYVETLMNDENTGSEYVVATDLDAVGPGQDCPGTDANRVDFTGGTDETIGLVDADWIGSATGGTGLYAFDMVTEFTPVGAVGNNSAALVHSAAEYCRNRIWFEYITYVPDGATVTAAVSYRENTLGLDSSYVSLYAGGMKVFDPAGAGSSPRRNIRAVGAMMGLRGRVDGLPAPAGGAWQTPAGEGDYGRLRTALDVADEYNDTDHGTLNDAHINTIRKFGTTSPVLVWGGRTLDASAAQRYRYINVRRFFQFVEKSIADSTRWAVFRNNDFRLWGTLKDRIDAFLLGLMADRAFPTSEKALAFFILVGITDGVMDQSNVDAGEVIGEIGLAPQKPGEFIIFRFAQFNAGTDITEI